MIWYRTFRVILRARGALKRTVVGYWLFENLSGSHPQVKVFGSLYALHNKFLPFPQRLIRFLCCVLRQFCCCQEKQLPSHWFFFVSICWQLSHAVKEALKDIFRHSNKAEWVKTRIHSSIVDPDASVLWILEKKTRVCSFNSWKISNMVYIVDYKISPYLCLDESGLDKARILRR